MPVTGIDTSTFPTLVPQPSSILLPHQTTKFLDCGSLKWMERLLKIMVVRQMVVTIFPSF